MNVNLAITRNVAIDSKLSVSTEIRRLIKEIQPEVVVLTDEDAN